MLTWTVLLLYLLLFNYTASDAIKDGIIDRGKTSSGRVGWKQFHYVAWRTRWPTQAAFGALIVFSWEDLLWQVWHAVCVLLVCSLHAPFYNWAVENRDKFTGDESKYKLWAWLHELGKKLIPWL